MQSIDKMIEEVQEQSKKYVSPESLGLLMNRKVVKGELYEWVKSCAYNLDLILRHHPHFDSLFWDDFSYTIRYQGEKMSDHETTRIKIWLERVYEVNIPEKTIEKGMYLVARDRPKNLFKEYLDGLEWDGEPRLDRWLIDYLGVEDTPLHRTYSKKYLVGACRRACYSTLKNPVKFDTILILFGGQDIMKSLAVEALAISQEWFSDEEIDIRSKDYNYHIQGKLLLEMAEWAGRTKDINAEKAWVTKKIDRYRPVHKSFQFEAPRRTSFIITTNESNLFRDATGSRRFWAVETGHDYKTDKKTGKTWASKWKLGKTVKIKDFKEIVPQLWAEAYILAQDKTFEHWLNPDEKRQRQDANAAFNDTHPWTSTVEKAVWGLTDANHLGEWPNPLATFETTEVMEEMKLFGSEQNRKNKSIIEGILLQLGYHKNRRRIDGKRKFVWGL